MKEELQNPVKKLFLIKKAYLLRFLAPYYFEIA